MVDNSIIVAFIDALLNKFEVLGNKVTSWSATPSDTKYPSEKLVKDSLDTKLEAADLPTKTSEFTNDGSDGSHPFLDTSTGAVSVEKQASAESGYAATYVIKQGGTALSPKINIPKDFLVKSASMGTVDTADTPVEGYSVGDKYLDFVINTKENDGTDEHIYINVADLIDTYTADNTSLELSNNQFSIKASGVDTAQIKNSAVTADKIADAVKDTWLTTSDVDGEIDDYLTAITTALNS